jgi:hypothetical protein
VSNIPPLIRHSVLERKTKLSFRYDPLRGERRCLLQSSDSFMRADSAWYITETALKRTP